MSKKIKAIILDGDGSTITHTNELPDNLRDLMLANRHIYWIMATGRSLDLLQQTPIAPYLTTEVPHILDGGSRLMYLNASNLVDHFITKDELIHFFSIVNLEHVNFIYYSPDGINGYVYLDSDNSPDNFKHHGNNVSYAKDIAEFRDWVFKLPPTKLLLNVKQQILLPGLNYHTNENNIDITRYGVDKGFACVKLLKFLNILPNEVAFVFNDKNDLPIINNKDLTEVTTIKVGDYLPEVKSTYSVASPYDVASIIQNLI